ncbi:MAG: GMC family oxidoreductase N-terminal domain-containing protein [Gammaproteobacteria bacterium]|nr:GMC family oxidoreductase N-terminal domain-containing protein [Gammaproteobacteria bacterium]
MSQQQRYDYIIAGAGSAGCALAARLCENPDVSVCLIEAGGNGNSLFVRMPAGNGFIFGNPKFDWGYESAPQPGLDGRKIYYPRGKGLGGTSLLNGLIYMRGNRQDFDRWRAMGIPGWGYDELLPYFKKLESAPHHDSHFHGHDGPLRVTPAVNYEPVNQAFVEAAMQAGARHNADFNGASQIGVGRIDAMVYNGQRQSTSASYLKRLPANLTILTHTQVRKIELQGRRAIGVKISRRGRTESIRAEREVISCLGAFESPRLLMLSGIGPTQHLSNFDIPTLVDLPGVGSDLQDHPNIPLTFTIKNKALSYSRYQRLDRAIWLGLRYLFTRKGPACGTFWSSALFHAFDGGDLPDVQAYCTPMVVKEEAAGAGWNLQNLLNPGKAVIARGKIAAPGIQFDTNLMRPAGRGRVRLASSSADDPPLIDADFLRKQRDIDDAVQAVELMRDITSQAAFDGIVGEEIAIGAQARSKAEIASALRQHVTTGHHPVSTCRIGADNDPGAVLDERFRVRGVEGLRVVDASAFPDQISGNPSAAIIMMAERAADFLGDNPRALNEAR